jgi:cytidine deaminase
MNTDKILIEAAKKALTNSYSPYSKLRVGASLITSSGRIFTGTNIENASYGLTICAERSAIFAAISEGERSIKKMAIISGRSSIIVPCGACLQVLCEVAPKIELLLCSKNGKFKRKKLSDILKMIFKP